MSNSKKDGQWGESTRFDPALSGRLAQETKDEDYDDDYSDFGDFGPADSQPTTIDPLGITNYVDQGPPPNVADFAAPIAPMSLDDELTDSHSLEIGLNAADLGIFTDSNAVSEPTPTKTSKPPIMPAKTQLGLMVPSNPHEVLGKAKPEGMFSAPEKTQIALGGLPGNFGKPAGEAPRKAPESLANQLAKQPGAKPFPEPPTKPSSPRPAGAQAPAPSKPAPKPIAVISSKKGKPAASQPIPIRESGQNNGEINALRRNPEKRFPGDKQPLAATSIAAVPVKGPDANLKEGTRLGNYEIVRRIGQGGMGVVYEGRHLLLPRKVAIKFLKTEEGIDEEQIRRFLGEAVASSQIGHRGVVDIYDYGHDPQNSAYLIMEFLDGQSLQAIMKRGSSLPLATIFRVVREIADILRAAHETGIVHRDLKPDNIFLARDENGHDYIKILDFGVAKFVDAQAMSGKTKVGSILGTPWYMPPEQCKGSLSVDFRSDIYALGCVFYQMICGKVPFSGSLRDVLIAQIHKDPQPPRSLNPSCPPEVEALILKMMAKDPADRPNSMADIASTLDGYVEPAPVRDPRNRQEPAQQQQQQQMPPRVNTPPQGYQPQPTPQPGGHPAVRHMPQGGGSPWVKPLLLAVVAAAAAAAAFFLLQ